MNKFKNVKTISFWENMNFIRDFIMLFLVVLSFNSCIRKEDVLTDPRDGHTYRIVKIDGHWWMAQNLNFKPSEGLSWCYDDNEENCNTYGRLYNWTTALKACPDGWRLPSYEEWGNFLKALKNDSDADNSIKDFLNMYPGYRGYHGFFYRKDEMSFLWSSTESRAYYSWCLISDKETSASHMAENVALVGLSVRCIRN